VHPIEFVESALSVESGIRHVQFSKYRRHPQSLLDDCLIQTTPVARLRSAFARLKLGLRENENVAFNSVITLRGRASSIRHLAMLDFVSASARKTERACEILISEYSPRTAALVHSGRSYHLYMAKLMSRRQWVRFMGRVLLLNPHEGPPIIDSRWVGHRLMAGYAALRWTINDRRHSPTVIRLWGC
jgi:hypothetical protein